MSDPIIPPLDGAADSNTWNFSANHGPLPNPVGHTFPLMTHNSNGQWQLIGTGFYISSDGLFVTAKHVIDEVLEADQQVRPLAIFHLRSPSGLFGTQELLIRPISHCWKGEMADIALGVAAQAKSNITGEILSHWHWSLSWNTPPVGTRIGTYAFPNHAIKSGTDGQRIVFRPDFYQGNLQELADFRDQVMVPYPYFHANFRIHGGASGGPVLVVNGSVIGVNCTELKPDGPGFGAQIRCLQNAFIDDAIMPNEDIPRQVTFSELVSAGVVPITDFQLQTIDNQGGETVRLDLIPIEGQSPELETVIFS